VQPGSLALIFAVLFVSEKSCFLRGMWNPYEVTGSDSCSELRHAESKLFHNLQPHSSKKLHVMWVLCYHGMARPQDAGGGDGHQVWRVAKNILN
jgi:hypothetical protein